MGLIAGAGMIGPHQPAQPPNPYGFMGPYASQMRPQAAPQQPPMGGGAFGMPIGPQRPAQPTGTFGQPGARPMMGPVQQPRMQPGAFGMMTPYQQKQRKIGTIGQFMYPGFQAPQQHPTAPPNMPGVSGFGM